jgi:hypothetical protein
MSDVSGVSTLEDSGQDKSLRRSYLYQLLSVLLPDSLLVAIGIYTLTGVVSPTLVDYLSHTYDLDQYALFPVLSTAIGLALVVPLSKLIYVAESIASTPSISVEDNRKSVQVAGIDLVATSLVTIGLVNVGCATFTVIYSSAAAWTALMSWRSGNKLSSSQILGVFLVTFGLFINGVGHVFEDETRSEAGLIIFASSCLALLFGTILHSVVMVKIDEFTRESRSRALSMASRMGRWEIIALLLWNAFRLTIIGRHQSTPDRGHLSMVSALLWFALLSVNQSLHALAFFSMIGRLGAVGSAVLKGFLALNTFGLAAALFCEKGHSEQCLSPLKTISMLLVMFGGMIYGIASKRKTQQTKPELPL